MVNTLDDLMSALLAQIMDSPKSGICLQSEGLPEIPLIHSVEVEDLTVRMTLDYSPWEYLIEQEAGVQSSAEKDVLPEDVVPEVLRSVFFTSMESELAGFGGEGFLLDHDPESDEAVCPALGFKVAYDYSPVDVDAMVGEVLLTFDKIEKKRKIRDWSKFSVEDAKDYFSENFDDGTSRSEVAKQDMGFYSFIRKMGWQDEILPLTRRRDWSWMDTPEKAKDFYEKNYAGLSRALVARQTDAAFYTLLTRKGWLDKVFPNKEDELQRLSDEIIEQKISDLRASGRISRYMEGQMIAELRKEAGNKKSLVQAVAEMYKSEVGATSDYDRFKEQLKTDGLWQRDARSLFTFFPIRGSSLNERLLMQGVSDIDAAVISLLFDNLQECCPASAVSKNQVYHITDIFGDKKVIKLVSSKEEAEMESFVNYHFSRHPVLQRFTPISEIQAPAEVQLGDVTKYLVIQEDVSDVANPWMSYALTNGTKKELDMYINYWMRTLAKIHVYGSSLMNALGATVGAHRITKQKDELRIDEASNSIILVGDPELRKDVVQMNLEFGTDFVHQDIRAENRVGEYAIDWGHAGWGNGLLDVARILSDADVQRYGMNDADYTRHLHTYLQQKKLICGKGLRVESDELKDTFSEFNAMRLLLFQAHSAYLFTKGDACTINESLSKDFMVSSIPSIERSFLGNISSLSHVIRRHESDDAIVYFLPSRDSVSRAA